MRNISKQNLSFFIFSIISLSNGVILPIGFPLSSVLESPVDNNLLEINEKIRDLFVLAIIMNYRHFFFDLFFTQILIIEIRWFRLYCRYNSCKFFHFIAIISVWSFKYLLKLLIIKEISRNIFYFHFSLQNSFVIRKFTKLLTNKWKKEVNTFLWSSMIQLYNININIFVLFFLYQFVRNLFYNSRKYLLISVYISIMISDKNLFLAEENRCSSKRG